MNRIPTTPNLASASRGTMTPEEVRRWRMSHGWSQADAAKLLGISPRKYYCLESGNTAGGYRLKTISRADELMIKGLDSERPHRMLKKLEEARAKG